MPATRDENEETATFLARAIVDDTLPSAGSVSSVDHLIDQMHYHGVCGLLADKDLPATTDWPAPLVAAARAQAIGQAMWEMRHRALLHEVFEALSGRGLTAITLKGTALAYSLYQKPAHRFRGDTDLLIASRDIECARLALKEVGLVRQANTHGYFGDLHFQEIWQKVCSDGTIHDIDLHWRVTNSEFLDRVLSAEEFIARSIPLPQLHATARMPDLVLALAHACINRASHQSNGYFWLDEYRYDGNRLIWAYDIHLIASRLSPEDWNEFVDIVASRGVASICSNALNLAITCLGTRVPRDALLALIAAPSQSSEVAYLVNRNELNRTFMDVRALQGMPTKMKFLLARAFPSRAFMVTKYPNQMHWPLALLYIRRLAAAVAKALGV